MATDRPILTRVIDRVRQNRPLAAAIAEGVLNAARRTDTAVRAEDRDIIVRQVQDAIAADPVMASQVSAEPWYQNRIRVGLLITAAGFILNRMGVELGLSDEDKELWSTIIMAFGASIAALGEWLSKWLAGVDWKRPWTLFGIGR